jgi:cell wall-associated NlpC family hydrolase
MKRTVPLLVAVAALLLLHTLPVAAGEDVLQIARSFSDGGQYKWKGSGTPEAIVFKEETILSASAEGTYCSGFTFAVVMRAAARRGLLEDKTVDQIRRFQKQWYGATKESAEVQAAFAMENLGIGRTVSHEEARPGDFLQFWREDKSGHSVVFLAWIEEDGRKAGFRYRSTQKSTDGIGDRTEYFSDSPDGRGRVARDRTYFARLNTAAR